MKFLFAVLVVVAAALPVHSAPAQSGVGEETKGAPAAGREKKSYKEMKGEAGVPCVGSGLGVGAGLSGHAGIGANVDVGLGHGAGLGHVGAGVGHAGAGLLPVVGPYGVGPYYGLRPWGGLGLDANLGGGAGNYRDLIEQRIINDAKMFKLNAAGETQGKQVDETRSALGYGGHGLGGGYGGGALGVFPGAIGGCGGIPLLVSCSPSLVAGHVVSAGYGHGHGLGLGGLYRQASQLVDNKTEQKVMPPAPAGTAATAQAHHKVASSFQQRHSASSVRVGGGSSFNSLA